MKKVDTEKQIERVCAYLRRQYRDRELLTKKEAFGEIGFEHDEEMEKVLWGDGLPSLFVEDVSRYIVLYT